MSNLQPRNLSPEDMISTLPREMADKVGAIPDHVWEMSELEFWRKCPQIDDTVMMLRYAFWKEWDRAVKTKQMVHSMNIYAGITSKGAFRKKVSNSFVLAYILTPPPDFEAEVSSLIRLGMDAMWEIMKADVYETQVVKGKKDSEGNPVTKKVFSHKTAALKRTILNDLINRKYGKPVERVESKSLTATAQIGGDQALDLLSPNADVQEKLKGIDEELKQLEGARDVSNE